MEDDGIPTLSSSRMMMRKVMSWVGLRKDVPVESTIHYGEQWQDQRPGKDVVLDHIILDLTGGAAPLEQTEDPSVQRAIKKKKRLLRHSNTVLISRLAIMVLVAIMLVVTTLLTWYFTSTYGARSVKSLATVLRGQLLRTSTQTMVSVLGGVYNSTIILGYLHQQVFYGSSNRSWESVELELRPVNRGVFNAQHEYTSVAFVSADGRVTDYSRSANENKEYFFFVNATYDHTQVWYYQDLTGIVNETDAAPPQLRKPPYPLSAQNVLSVKPQEVIWTIAPNLLGVPVVSPAVPTRDIITNTFLGLATITTTFETLNRYLAALDLLGGFLYFEWHNETERSSIVAFSYSGTNDILVSPQNASNPIVKAAATFLVATYGYDVMSLGETHDENVDLGGHKYYIDTMPILQEPFNILNLTAVMIVPRKSIMGRIDQRNRTVVGASVGTSIGVLVLGCCFICFLTSKMSTEMQLRQELIRSLVGKHRAEQSSNYKSQFLANMSHELRTPLAGIIGLLDLLSCDSLTSEQEFSVSQVRRCATGLLSLVNNVLDISKVEAGRMELEIVPFNVANELESLVDMFAAQSVGSKIDIVLDLSDNIPPVVSGDVTRIRQIFSNLISNSVKFTTSGHVLVRGWIDQSLLEPDRRHIDINNANKLSGRDKIPGPLFMGTENKVALVFEVNDSGCGIPVELQDMVFESFVQGDSSTTRMYGGSGLGLYIVRSLVELMGGEVAVVPTESGTLIRFHIMVERASSPILGQTISGDHPALSSPSEPDGLYSLLGFPPNLFEPVKCPLPEVLQRTQVLVAMQEGVAREVAVQWLERSGIVKVTCAKGWEDIIPTLEDMCKSSLIESVKDVQKDDLSEHGIGPLHSPTHVHSLKSSSQLSENSLESVNFPSVLALIDVTMHPSMNTAFEGNFVAPRVLGSRESALCRADNEPLPSNMRDILACMLRIHSQHSIAVGWIVPTDCGARWKQALQGDGCFLVMNKPLHGSRMRRLLALLSRTGKLEQHHWEVHSYQSSSTSTPKLRTTCTSPSEGEDLQSHMADYRELSGHNAWTPSDRSMYTAPPSSDDEVMYYKAGNVGRVTGLHGSQVDARGKAEPVAQRNGEFGLQASLPDSSEDSRKIGLDTTDSPNLQVVPPSLDVLPQGLSRFQKGLQVDNSYGADERRSLLGIHSQHSPISGLVTHQVENSNADGVQIVQRDEGVEFRVIEEEQSEPVIGLGLPEKVQLMQSLVSGRPAPLTDPKPEGQLSHEKTVAVPDDSRAGQAATLTEVKNTVQSSQENTVTTQVASTATANSASVYGSKALSSMHILLVEDTPVLQRLANMMLKKLGANVTVVGDGLQAVTAVTGAVAASEGVAAARVDNIPYFDLILMDCAMPVMDGYNATKAIRAAEENTSRHIPIVALTAHALASDEQRCLAVGMDAYLTKPINCKLMVSTIQDLVSKGRA